MTFRLLWVPPRLKMETIRKIVQSTFGEDATACRPKETKDQGRVDVTLPYEKDFDPPHYLEVDRMGKQGKVEQTLWFVSLKGRRQQCHYCHSPHHWPIRCPTKNAPPKTRAEEVLGRRAEQARSEPTRRAQQAPTDTFGIQIRKVTPPPSPRHRGDERGLGSHYGSPRGLAQSGTNNNISLDDYEDNLEFKENEIAIQVSGLKAVTSNYAEIQSAIMKALQETPDTYQDQRVYRLEDPTRWYLTTCE